MQRYEQLGIDLTTKEGFLKVMDICPKSHEKGYACKLDDCDECAVDYLFSEVPTKKVKRWETYNGDFRKAYKEFDKTFVCDKGCPNDVGGCACCFVDWLMEEIEVEE